MADINKIPIGGVVTLTHSLAVYNSAVNGLLLNLIDFFFEKQRFYNQFPAPVHKLQMFGAIRQLPTDHCLDLAPTSPQF